MKIIGRVDEKQFLSEILKHETSQFVAVYGRRRVGKTFLIRSVYEKYIIFECAGGLNSTKAQNLDNFNRKLIAYSGSKVRKPKSWLDAFESMQNYIDALGTRKKKVIFLDEISWYDTLKSGFVGALADFWNSYCTKRNDIVLVICGSAASWIIEKVINDKGGLHNRLNRTIRLQPFTIGESKKFLYSRNIKLSTKEFIQLFMCTGGIPFYLDAVKPGKSLPQIIDDLFLRKNAIFKDEFQNLYSALFKNHKLHLKVIKALASKNKGLTRSEILKFGKFSSGGAVSDVIEELIQCGFIDKQKDFDKNVTDGLYRLIDEYTLFYYKFLKTKVTSLKGKDLLNSHSFISWSGFAFEILCMKHADEIAAAMSIAGISYDVYSFIDKGTKDSEGVQIDMVMDRADNVINIFELKFYNDSYKMTSNEASKIKKRLNRFIEKTETKKTIFVTLITPYGAIKNTAYHSIITNELTAKDVL